MEEYKSHSLQLIREHGSHLSTMAVTQEVVIGTLLLGAICIGVWAWHQIQKAKEEQEEHERKELQRNCGRTMNNHDQQKRQYRTQDEADGMINRMQGQGLYGDGTLRSYYNSDYGRWFVGNGCW